MPQNLEWIRDQVQKPQLAYILDDCFDTEELTSLVLKCCSDKSLGDGGQYLHLRPNRGTPPPVFAATDQCPRTQGPVLSGEVNSFPSPSIKGKSHKKEWFVHWLTEDFFDYLPSFQAISDGLSQEIDLAKQQIGYMNPEEILYFLSCPNQLQEQGIYGRTVWALLQDKRNLIQQHGIDLLQACDYPDFVPNRFEGVDRRDGIVPLDQPGYLRPVLIQLKDQLHQLENENKNIKQQNQELQRQLEISTQEYTKLETANSSFKKELVPLEDYEAHISTIEFENEKLRQEMAQQSLQLKTLQEVQLRKTEFDLELSTLEDLNAKTEDTFHQMVSEFRSNLDKLEWLHQSSKKAVGSARKRLLNLVPETVQGTEIQNGAQNSMISDYLHSDQPKVGVFVDVQNMFYAAKDRYASRLDYIKLLDLTVGPRRLVAAYAYIVQIPEIDQSSFLALLEHNGYRIKAKDLRLRGDGSAKGDWDVGIAIDIVSMLDVLDVVILASGDGDFCPLAELVQQKNKRIEVIAFEHNTAMDLQRLVDQFYPVGSELLI
ncbi:MAG: NYN domain-containing protein [Candidatus Poribacteria bacterium]|jgi:uncharacterized LabA/DUF88 family protein|nr:NYN domain-containing protein [Candidatus Poribacteria bacterium]